MRHYWDAVYKAESEFRFVKSVEGMPMYMALFDMAGEEFESEADTDQAIAALLASYVTITSRTDG